DPGMGGGEAARGGRGAADHHAGRRRPVLAALPQGLRPAPQRHLQQLALRRRLAGETESGGTEPGWSAAKSGTPDCGPLRGRFIRTTGDLLLFRDPDLAELTQHAWVNEIGARRGGERVCGGRLARLRQLLAERALEAVESAGQPIGDIVLERRARQDEAPRADRTDFRALARVAPGRHGERLE